jgi:nucleotide-binding universal stress UspA family protein
MKNILVGYDGTETAKAALTLAKEHAGVFNSKIYIVKSLPGGEETTVDDVKAAEQDLEYAKGVCEKDNIPCETHLLIRGVMPGEDIVRFAEDNEVDEVIVGVKRRSKVGKLMFGSTAQYVVLEASCPVVTVK